MKEHRNNQSINNFLKNFLICSSNLFSWKNSILILKRCCFQSEKSYLNWWDCVIVSYSFMSRSEIVYFLQRIDSHEIFWRILSNWKNLYQVANLICLLLVFQLMILMQDIWHSERIRRWMMTMKMKKSDDCMRKSDALYHQLRKKRLWNDD